MIVSSRDEVVVARSWRSSPPRISFSARDGCMLPLPTLSNSALRQEEEEHYKEMNGSSESEEFEFCLLKDSNHSVSSEEIFANGKLRPLQIPAAGLQLQGVEWGAQSSRDLSSNSNIPRPRPGHHSVSVSPRYCTSMLEGCPTHLISLSVHSSRSSSPTRSLPSFTPLPHFGSTTTTAKISPPLSTCTGPASSRLKDFFKSSRKVHESTQRISRSFWLFSRSNSASESSNYNTPATLPPRSNSVDEAKCGNSKLTDQARRGVTLPIKDLIYAKHRDSFNPSSSCIPSLATATINLPPSKSNSEAPSRSKDCPPLPQTVLDNMNCNSKDSDLLSYPSNAGFRSGQETAQNVVTIVRPMHIQASGRLSKRGNEIEAQYPGRGSPSQRGVWNVKARGNNGKRDIQRCGRGRVQIESKDGCKIGSHRLNSSPTGMMALPFLNMPSCIGPPIRTRKGTKNKLFNMRSLFYKKDRSTNVDVAANLPRKKCNGA